MPSAIAHLHFQHPLFLAPLAGYTNLPFRLVTRAIGGVGLCTTDLVNARSLIERNPKALALIASCPEDQPLAIQLFGGVPDEMCEAARFAESQGAASIDINMGCPVPKVCKVGAGSSLMRAPSAAADLARAVARAVRAPVTCKMRLGWDAQNITAPDLARALADAGVAALFVHGRTRDQGFAGPVSLEGIASVVAAVPGLPVIGNGDVTTPELALRMMRETGCAGVAIGRGAFYNPWIFRQTAALLDGGAPGPEPGLPEREAVMRRHLDLMVQHFGEPRGCRMFRKVAPWYTRGLGPHSAFHKRVAQLESRAEFDEILAEFRTWRARFLDADGDLLPQYRPKPGADPFTSQPASAVAVPKGPVDLW